MDDKKLEAFMTIVRTGSFCRAAEEMGCTQSGLTQTVNSLEKELGCRLLDRHYRGVTVSADGRSLLPFIEQTLRDSHALKSKARALRRQTGSIRIGTFSSLAATLLPQVLKEFKQAYPNISVSIRVGATEVPDWLDRGEIDLALLDDSRKHSFRFTPILHDPFMAVVPESFSAPTGGTLTLQELLQHPFIMIQLNELKSQIEQLPGLDLNEGIQLNSADDAVLISMVEQGLGVTVMTELCLRGKQRSGIKVYPITPLLSRTLGIAVAGQTSPEVEKLIACIKQYTQKMQALL